jgi:hypothetical protein
MLCLLQDYLLAAAFPSLARDLLEGIFEIIQLPALVEVAFELGDITMLAVIPAHLVEDFQEDREHRIDLAFADRIRFLIDVKQDALGWDGDCLAHLSLEHGILTAFGQEIFDGWLSINELVFEQQRQHFQQMGFT